MNKQLREMSQSLGAHSALTEDPGLASSTHIRQLITSYNSNLRG